MPAESKLTPKQGRFCQEYIIDLNATQAAIRAGYSQKTAGSVGAENLTKPEIQSELARLMSARNQRTEITADWVLTRLVSIDEMDILDIMNDDLSFKPLSQWPKVWRITLTGIDIVELSASQDKTALIKKIKWPDKVKNIELIGKHVNVKAFEKEQQSENTAETLAATLANLVDKLPGA